MLILSYYAIIKILTQLFFYPPPWLCQQWLTFSCLCLAMKKVKALSAFMVAVPIEKVQYKLSAMIIGITVQFVKYSLFHF